MPQICGIWEVPFHQNCFCLFAYDLCEAMIMKSHIFCMGEGAKVHPRIFFTEIWKAWLRIFYMHSFVEWYSFQLLNVSHYWSTYFVGYVRFIVEISGMSSFDGSEGQCKWLNSHSEGWSFRLYILNSINWELYNCTYFYICGHCDDELWGQNMLLN